MASSTLILHKGGKPIDLDTLIELEPKIEAQVKAQAGPGYQYIPYSTLIGSITDEAQYRGFEIQNLKIGVSETCMKLWAVGDLVGPDTSTDELNLAIGIRSSHDRSIAFNANIGARILACDNGAFCVEDKKGSVRGRHVPSTMVSSMVYALFESIPLYKEELYGNINRMKAHPFSPDDAWFSLRDLWQSGSLAVADIGPIYDQFIKPKFEAFQEHTENLWGFYNAITWRIGQKTMIRQAEMHADLLKSPIFNLGSSPSPSTKTEDVEVLPNSNTILEAIVGVIEDESHLEGETDLGDSDGEPDEDLERFL